MGALDGKHISFRPLKSAGSFYRNYKGSDSIVLLALVDASYRFLIIDVGMNGRISDGGIFGRSILAQALQNNTLNIPSPKPLPGRHVDVPYVVVADEAFPLKTNIMKPFRFRGLTNDQKIYNYRLSRARRVVENAFGILSNRFRIFLKPMNVRVEKVELITKAACILHNFLLKTNSHSQYLSNESDDGQCELIRVIHQGGNRTTRTAQTIREEFKHYFNQEGVVSWQQEAVERHNM